MEEVIISVSLDFSVSQLYNSSIVTACEIYPAVCLHVVVILMYVNCMRGMYNFASQAVCFQCCVLAFVNSNFQVIANT